MLHSGKNVNLQNPAKPGGVLKLITKLPRRLINCIFFAKPEKIWYILLNRLLSCDNKSVYTIAGLASPKQEIRLMCDASNMFGKTHDAREGEHTTIHDFGGHEGRWLQSSAQKGPKCGNMVCLREGATVMFRGIPEAMQAKYGFEPTERAIFREGAYARSRQVPREKLDHFFFRTGDNLLINEFPVGLEVQIVSLTPQQLLPPAAPTPTLTKKATKIATPANVGDFTPDPVEDPALTTRNILVGAGCTLAVILTLGAL